MASTTYYYAWVGKCDIEEQLIQKDRLKDYANAWIEIVHDKDENTEAHIHLLFSSYKKIKKIQELIGSNIHLEQVQDEKAYARYMLHMTDASIEDGKHRYKVTELECSSKRFLNELGLRQKAEEVTISDKATILQTMVRESKSFNELVAMAIDNNVYDELRRGFTLWKTLWKEIHLNVKDTNSM